MGADAVTMDLITRLAPAFATYLTVPFERRLFATAASSSRPTDRNADVAGADVHPVLDAVMIER